MSDSNTPADAGDMPLPLPRDPRAAVAEELAFAIASGEVAQLELFIARYADDPLAEDARKAIEDLQAND